MQLLSLLLAFLHDLHLYAALTVALGKLLLFGAVYDGADPVDFSQPLQLGAQAIQSREQRLLLGGLQLQKLPI